MFQKDGATVGTLSQNITVNFTRSGIWAGMRRGLPLAASVFTYGLVFGMLARQAGLSIDESLLMSSLVYAGSSQFVALGLWRAPLPAATIIFTTLVVNLRHVLMGAALHPWFAQLPALHRYGSLFFLGDENWALTMQEFEAGGRDGAFLVGSGLPLFVAWFSATMIGGNLSTAIPDPARWGLDFAFTATFVALLVGMWQGKANLWPWGVAAVVAMITAQWLPGPWYIVLGGLAGSLVGAIRDAD
jgi:4-azaleucine resistance transporter AzlC